MICTVRCSGVHLFTKWTNLKKYCKIAFKGQSYTCMLLVCLLFIQGFKEALFVDIARAQEIYEQINFI